MNIMQPVAARQDFFDRAPKTVTLLYQAAGVAPHASTQRATYTVPAGRKARIMTIKLAHIRATASAPAGKTLANANYIPAVAAGITMALVQAINTAVGSGDELNKACQDVLLAGDALNLNTADASTGGTVDYDLGVAILEFDA